MGRRFPPTRSPSSASVFVGLEEAEERGVLGQIRLDLGDPGARPVLDPRVGQIVRDVMEAALAHGKMIGQDLRERHGPNGSTGRRQVLVDWCCRSAGSGGVVGAEAAGSAAGTG